MTDSLVSLLCRTSPLALLALFAGFALPEQSGAVDLDESGTLVIAHLDIKPGSCPNPLNVGFSVEELECVDGVMASALRVAVLGNKFDVNEIDLGSVSLSLSGVDGGVSVQPIQIIFEDLGTPFIGEGCECHAFTGDGLIDLSLRFDKQLVVDAFELAGEPDGSFVSLQVTGLATSENDGEVVEFRARDCVRIINHNGK